MRAQDTRARQQEQLKAAPKAVPSDVLQQVQALGLRMRSAGKEESVYEGQLTDEAGRQKAVRLVHPVSGLVRVESVQEKTALSFDGKYTSGTAGPADEAVMDALIMDSAEGMLYAVRTGASMQLLGRGFAPNSAAVPSYKGPRYDIYEIIGPGRNTNDPALRTRRFYFDSKTGLLASTRYADATGRSIETRFLNWGNVDGSVFPGKIERYANGRQMFSFVAAAISSQPRHDTTNPK
jgi:hypothetical protein